MAFLRSRPLAVALVVLASAGAPAAARADVSASAAPEYTTGTTRTRDETGRTTTLDLSQWVQRYRLDVSQQLYPLVTVAAGGNLNWTTSESRPSGGLATTTNDRAWTVYGRANMGDRTLNGGVDYVRRWEDAETQAGSLALVIPRRVRESYGASFAWNPADLPLLSLRLNRSNAFDEGRTTIDQTADEAQLTASYSPAESLDLRYTARYGRVTNKITDVVQSDVENSGNATWHSSYLGGRGTAYVSYGITGRTTDTVAPRNGTNVPLQRLAAAGLSVVETFPATPAQVTLRPNAALVDGDVSASSGVNLGTSASSGTGTADAFRDLGAQFQNVITPVNAIYVWVDRQLPPGLANLFTWTAYRSDDNVTWTPVTAAGPAIFNDVLFRFEVPIVRTSARYLKVVTKPLPAPSTSDPQFREIFVTELQFFDVIPAEEARGRRSDLSGALNATTRIVLVPDYGLSYDFSGLVAHSSGQQSTWSMTNGLSAARRLDPVFAVGARLERTDLELGGGRQAQNRWGVSLSADPLPTLGAVLSVNGQVSELPGGIATSNTGALSARADLYQGLAVTSTGSVTIGRNENGVDTRGTLVSASASLVPNRFVSLSGTASRSDATQSGGGGPTISDTRTVLDAAVAVSPFPALALSGTVSRQFGGSQPPTTLASVAGVLSPFQGGDLQLRYVYAESFDTAAQQRTRNHGPSATWKIRAGWFARASYTLQDAYTPAQESHAYNLNAALLITFR